MKQLREISKSALNASRYGYRLFEPLYSGNLKVSVVQFRKTLHDALKQGASSMPTQAKPSCRSDSIKSLRAHGLPLTSLIKNWAFLAFQRNLSVHRLRTYILPHTTRG